VKQGYLLPKGVIDVIIGQMNMIKASKREQSLVGGKILEVKRQRRKDIKKMMGEKHYAKYIRVKRGILAG
jgi:hypothetical protein